MGASGGRRRFLGVILQLLGPARQLGSCRNPWGCSRLHHQESHLQEQPVQPRSNSHRENRDESQNRKFQHGDHDVPPDLRFGKWHGHGQSQYIENTELIGKEGLWNCGD